MKQEFRSRVYTDRPDYADLPAPQKFQVIESIIGKRLLERPLACCSYSGGSDSDILIHLVERVRCMFELPPVKYIFFNTGLEMRATKDHVKATTQKYGVEIETIRPKKNIVLATREYGIPFVSKIMSSGLENLQRKHLPLEVHDEYVNAADKPAKYAELRARYPGCADVLNFICCCNSKGEYRPDIQLVINSSAYMLDFIRDNPIPFRVSARCCDWCKKRPAHEAQKGYDLVITGERRAEGGMRSVPRKDSTAMCFYTTGDGKARLRPLYYVTDADKAWYKDYYGIQYSDAYEVYGLKRTGCCGCSISSRAVAELEQIRPYEPGLVNAAWNVFGASYEYRIKYNEYRARRHAADGMRYGADLVDLAGGGDT